LGKIKFNLNLIKNNISLLLITVIFVFGCSGTPELYSDERSVLEQKLVIRSLERAMLKIDLYKFKGYRVFIELYTLTADKAFTQAYIVTQFEKKGIRIVSDRSKADIRLKVFAKALGVDYLQTFVGIPEISLTLLTIPELGLFKKVDNKGYTELQFYSFKNNTGQYLKDKSLQGIGKSKHTTYTILIFFKYSITDVNRIKE